MGTSRKDRAKNEASLLERLLSLIADMSSEIECIKGHVEAMSGKCLLPPPAPPRLDIYNRDFLLENRPNDVKNFAALSLPSVAPLEEIDYAYHTPLIAEVDYASLCFELETEDIEENVRRVHSPHHQEYPELPELEKSTYTQVNISEEIALAQKRARGFQRLRECSAVKSIQKVWKLIRPKLKNEIVAPLHQGFTSAKACGPHPGRQDGCTMESYAPTGEKLYDASRIDSYDSLTSMQNEYWINRSELTAEPRTERIGSSGEPRSGSSHSDGTGPFTRKLLSGEPRSGSSHSEKVDEYWQEINIFAKTLPADKRDAYIFRVFRGLADRRDLKEDESFAILRQLEHRVGKDLHTVLPFICQNCSEPYESCYEVCANCGDKDIFDSRKCVCGHLKICKIGSCCESDSDDDYYPSSESN